MVSQPYKEGGSMKSLNFRMFLVSTVIGLLMVLSCSSAFAAVAGSIQNSSSRAGWAFVSLKGSDNSYGTAIKFTANATKAFTINGVPDGTYTVSAWLDTGGTGIRHRFDPFFQRAGTITVSGGNGTAGTLTLAAVTPSLSTEKPAAPDVYPASGGVLVSFADWKLNGFIVSDAYKLTCGLRVIDNIPVNSLPLVYLPLDQGGDLSCTVTPKINNKAYTSNVSPASTALTVAASTCAATTVNSCGTGFTVNGSVHFPGIATSQNSYMAVVLTNLDDPSAVPYTALVNSFSDHSASFSIPGVPRGKYGVKAILDLDGNRVLGAGDAAVNPADMPRIVVDGKGEDEAGTVTVPGITLKLSGSVAGVGTVHDYGIPGDASNPESYGLTFTVLDADKIPVAVELCSGYCVEPSNPRTAIARSFSGAFTYTAAKLASAPYAGDSYEASVTYSDGTTETKSMRVYAVSDDFAMPSLVSGVVNTNGVTRALAWRTPQPLPGYLYSYRTTMSGTESSEIPSGKLSDLRQVAVGQSYSWILSVLDSLGNSAVTHASFATQSTGVSISGFAPVTGPAGTTVAVSGSGFGTDNTNVTVSFNGTVAAPADIVSVSDSQIQVAVPAEASSGPILVTVNGVTAISETEFTPTVVYSGTVKDVGGNAVATAKVRKIGNSSGSSADGTGSFSIAATGFDSPDTAIPAGVPFELKIFDDSVTPQYRPSYTSMLSSLADVTGAAFALVKDSDLDSWAVTDAGFTDVKNSLKGMIRGQVLDANGSAVDSATVSLKSLFHPDGIPSSYVVYYGNAASPHEPLTFLSSSDSSGWFYAVGLDAGDVVTAVASATNGMSFAPTSYQVRAGAVSLGAIRGDNDPAYINVTAAPPAGAYNEPQNVTFSTSHPATVYYTTNGSDPRLYGTKYTGAITVSEPTKLTYAVKNSIGRFGPQDSAYYYINTAFAVRAVPPGSIAPSGGGTYKTTVFPVDVRFKANRAAIIYYTTNGSDPTNSPNTLTVAAASLSDPVTVSIDPTVVKFYAKEQAGPQSATDIQSWTFSSGGTYAVALTLKDSHGHSIANGGTASGIVTATATVTPTVTGSVLFVVDGVPRWPKVAVVNGTASTDIAGLPALGSTHTIQANFYNDAGTQTANSTQLSITTLRALFTPVWGNVEGKLDPITYGTPLSHVQLNAALPAGAPLTGTFSYDPPFGTIPIPGTHTLKANFVPDDIDSFQSLQVTVELTVLKATPEITWVKPADITYGTLLDGTQLNALFSVAGICTYKYADKLDNNTLKPADGVRLHAGLQTLSVTCTPTDSLRYNAVQASVAITVTKAPLTVSAEPASRTYGDANPAFVPTYTGFVTGDDASVLTGAPKLTTTATTASKVGSYAVTTAVGTLKSSDYAFTFTPGTLTIEKAVITVGVKDTLLAEPLYDYSRGYGEANPPFTPTYSGFKNGQTLATSGIAGKPDIETIAEITSPPGVYFIQPSIGSLTAANYSFIFTQGFLKVEKYPSKVTVSSSKLAAVYGNPVTFTATVTPTIATGTVQFRINGVDTGDPVALANGVAVSAPVNKPVGSYTITAVYGGESLEFIINSNPATIPTITGSTSAAITQTVAKAAQTIDFPAIGDQLKDAAPFDLTATASSGLPVSYSVVAGGTIASVSGSTVTLSGKTGSVTIRASQAGDTNYKSTYKDMTFVVKSQSQSITFDPLPAKTYGDAAFTLNATSTSLLAVTYTSSNTAVATISGKTVTIRGAGTTIITASQVGNATYAAATPVTQTLTVSKKDDPQTITFAAIPDKTYGNLPFALAATASSALPVSFSVVSGPATLSGKTLTITGVGTVTIRASQAGNDRYAAAPDVDRTFNVAKASQTVTFALLASRPCVNNGTFTLAATASSKLPVTYVSSDPGVATVSGNVVTIVGVGMTQITASQSGNDNYNAAADLTRALSITKGTQTITFPAIPNKPLNAEPFALSATASSGLEVSYRIVSGPATVSGSTVTLDGTVGTVIVEATQIGNSNFSAAPKVSKTFYVRAQDQTITFGALDPKTYGDAAFKLSATSNRGLTVTYTSSNPAVATVSGNTVTIKGAGTTTITATQAGTTTYGAAAPVSQTLTVDKKVLAVTAVDKVKYLNAVNPALTYAYSGFAYGQTATTSGVKGVPKLTTTALKESPIGDYPITVELNTLVSNNYSFNLVDGTLSVVLP